MKSQCYCIKLRKAARRISSLYDEVLEPFGINVAQYSLLKTIQRTGPINLTDLAEEAELERSTMGRNVQVLRRMGLLDQKKGKDQRQQVILLSGRGTEVLSEALPIWRACQDKIGNRLGDGAIEILDKILEEF